MARIHPTMTQIAYPGAGRRKFLKLLGAGALAPVAFPALGADGANGRVRIGMIGCGSRGRGLANQFAGLSDVRIVALADPEQLHLDRTADALDKANRGKPALFRDYRELLDLPDVDAVVIASPNHWHTLHTIHACQAGKDVYTEKPVTHHVGEDAKLLEAEKKYSRIVQAGTQNRSDTGLIEAFDAIRSGEFGKILSVRGLCYRNRASIGKRDTPLTPPNTLDYNLWLGPGTDQPIMREKIHYDWHWDFNTGNGDIGNQGVHETDLITWVLGDPPPPTSVRSFGGRFVWDDAGNTPNMLTTWFPLAGVPVIFEVNNLWIRPGTNNAPAFKSIRVGVIVTCEGGEFRGGRGGGHVYAPDSSERLKSFPGDAGGRHARNFIDAVKSRRAEDLRAPLAASCRSSALAHHANTSYLAGTAAATAGLRDALPDHAELRDVLDTQVAHLGRWSVDADVDRFTLGADLRIDPATGRLTGPLAGSPLEVPERRAAFALPEVV